MLPDYTKSSPRARIALLATTLALVGALWLFTESNRDTEPATVIATSCGGFEADAHKLFDKGDSAALRGRFAPGDHVHLAIDFKGVGYSWELTGVIIKEPDVTGSGRWTTVTRSIKSTTPTNSTFLTLSRGDISGLARLEVEVDVITAGDGAITINKTSAVPSLTPPRVVSASCNAWTQVVYS